MTKDEIVTEIESLGIIVLIGGEYFITEKYKELLQHDGKAIMPILVTSEKVRGLISAQESLELINVEGDTNRWPSEIEHAVGRMRVEAFMNASKIPTHSPDGSYMLRGVPKECLTIIDNIVENDTISPIDMIRAVELYYKHSKMPKSFKNLLLEGLIFTLYNEFVSGELIKKIDPNNTSNSGNQKWG